MIDFIVVGQGEFKSPINTASVYQIERLNQITDLVLNREHLSIICEPDDVLFEQYVNGCIGIFNTYQSVGAVYCNYTFNNSKVYVPSFSRDLLVAGIHIPPINCIVRNSILNRIKLISNSPMELFLKITDTFAMYHLAEFLYQKKNFYSYITTKEDIKVLNEYFNSTS